MFWHGVSRILTLESLRTHLEMVKIHEWLDGLLTFRHHRLDWHDGHVPWGLEEEWNRDSELAASVYDSVVGRLVGVGSEGIHDVSDVDDERPGDGISRNPRSVLGLD